MITATLNIKLTHPLARVPTYATDGASAFDLYSTSYGQVPGVFDTGVAFEVPPGKVLLVNSRSGHGAKGVRLANSQGWIDSDYRGSVRILLDGAPMTINPGDRIAQAMLVDAPRVDLQLVDTLSETARGTGGFGSTGT